MRKTIIIYGLSLAGLITLLKYIEYSYLVHDFSIEFYIGIVAIFFTVLGVWVGSKITSRKVVHGGPFRLNEAEMIRLGISKREHEVLQEMSLGLSNQEIADKLFVSVNTVKTHSSNLFVKLEASRRTQAIQKAKELKLLP